MEFVKKFSGSSGHQTSTETNDKVSQDKPSGGFLSSLHSKMDKAAGGGRESEKNEDYLDKGQHIGSLLHMSVVILMKKHL